MKKKAMEAQRKERSMRAHQTGAVQQVDSAFFRYRAESIAVEPKIHQADIIRTAAIAKIHTGSAYPLTSIKLYFDEPERS
uniref:Uncharacterized protein n=1 Tax=Pristionchus pacificus TaxID=54126 RepID=A0A2A6CSI6_PRIPA|eukprot:PDM81172.1 hypothetical protein PRIPAC_36175 [Pristionchus pacificus]